MGFKYLSAGRSRAYGYTFGGACEVCRTARIARPTRPISALWNSPPVILAGGGTKEVL